MPLALRKKHCTLTENVATNHRVRGSYLWVARLVTVASLTAPVVLAAQLALAQSSANTGVRPGQALPPQAYAPPAVPAYAPPAVPAYAPPAATPYVAPASAPYAPAPAPVLLPPPTTPAPYIYPSVASVPAAPQAGPKEPGCLTIPPGYMLVPAATTLHLDAATERAIVTSEIAITDSQLGQLQRERKSLAGPILGMTLGYGGMVLSSGVALSAYGAAEAGHDEHTMRRVAYAFAGVAAAGLLLGVSGTARLVRRARHNRALSAEMKALNVKRAQLLRRLEYGATPGPGALEVALRGRF